MEKSLKEETNNRLEFLLALIFFSVMVAISFAYTQAPVGSFSAISVFDFFIIVLAVFRLTRLFVYDGIMQYVRDLCLIKERVVDAVTGEETMRCGKPTVGFRKVASDLLACPWCVGVWLAAIVIIFYTALPASHLIIMILAVAGLASFVQITINAIGWKAEREKLVVKDKEESQEAKKV